MVLSCTTSTITAPFEEPAFETSTSIQTPSRGDLRQRRRHSSYIPRKLSVTDQDNITLLIDTFLESLSLRLDFLEGEYGHLSMDDGVGFALSTLRRIRESCYNVSDEVIGAGRRRAKIIVDELEKREWYKDALARKETLELKVQEAVKIMDGVLQDFEVRAYATRDSSLAAAGEFMSEVKREVDSGLEKAMEVVTHPVEVAKRAKEALRIKIDEAVISARKHGLITYADLPEPWRVNPHVLKGYRFHKSKLECIRSMVGLSNETVNIWTHLIGLIIVAGIAFHYYPSSPIFHMSTKADVLIAGVFFVAAAKCLICSTLWHTMSSISDQPLMERFACVDYTGISMLVASSIMTTEYTAFYCDPISRWTYMGFTLVLGIGGTIVPWHPYFNRADKAWLRVAFYVTLAATGFIPVFQLTYTRGWDWVVFFYNPLWRSMAAYLLGAVNYAFKCPERWYPGLFDYIGGSHNLWHLAVLGGILYHYTAMQHMMAQAFDSKGQCSGY